MKIIVGSTNPAKIQAVKAAFNQVFTNVDLEIKGVKAESGVAEQPMTEQETLTGAHNRIKSAQALVPDADYYVSIEGGVEVKEEKLMLFGWAVVEQAGKTGQGRSATYEAPPFFYEMIVGQGNDLG